MFAARARLSTVVLESMMPGGQAAITDVIENYPGVASASGADLVQAMVEQATSFGAELRSEEATGVRGEGDDLVVTTASGDREAAAVIVASGTGYRKLGVPGEDELTGRGVSYCAVCDGPFYKDLEIAVVGGGDSALQEALYLTKFAARIHLVHRRDRFRGIPILGERVLGHEKIECLFSTVVEEIGGADGVESVLLRDVETNETRSLPVAGVFLFVGLEPKTAFLGDLVERDEKGFIVTDAELKTGVRGLLAAGDCRVKLLRQVSTAVGDGATAAFAAQRYIEEGHW
jgi:thioredoxin reductase (NADPH)